MAAFSESRRRVDSIPRLEKAEERLIKSADLILNAAKKGSGGGLMIN